jgi:hypothetical protein
MLNAMRGLLRWLAIAGLGLALALLLPLAWILSLFADRSLDAAEWAKARFLSLLMPPEVRS